MITALLYSILPVFWWSYTKCIVEGCFSFLKRCLALVWASRYVLALLGIAALCVFVGLHIQWLLNELEAGNLLVWWGLVGFIVIFVGLTAVSAITEELEDDFEGQRSIETTWLKFVLKKRQKRRQIHLSGETSTTQPVVETST